MLNKAVFLRPFVSLKRKGAGNYGRFLKMIDDLQTPKHKTNQIYRSHATPLRIFFTKCSILESSIYIAKIVPENITV